MSPSMLYITIFHCGTIRTNLFLRDGYHMNQKVQHVLPIAPQIMGPSARRSVTYHSVMVPAVASHRCGQLLPSNLCLDKHDFYRLIGSSLIDSCLTLWWFMLI